MKRAELLTILGVALVVATGGLFLVRPRQQASIPDPVLAESIPIDLPKAQPVPAQAVEPPAGNVELPIQKPAAVAAHDHDSSGPESADAPPSGSPAIYESNAELAAGVLPKELAGFFNAVSFRTARTS